MHTKNILREVRFRFVESKWPIYRQLGQYRDWKSVRHPFPAGTQYRDLVDFVRFSGIRDVREITLEDVLDYQETQNGQAGRIRTVHVLRQFLRFCKQAGYANIQIEEMKGKLRLEKVHSLLDVDQVLRVKKLRARVVDGQPMSYRKIKAYMEKKDGRKYDIKNIYKWANYQLPKGYEFSTS